MYDVDKDGYLTEDEVAKVYEDMATMLETNGKYVDNSQVMEATEDAESMIWHFDLDGDEQVDLDEFLSGFDDW